MKKILFVLLVIILPEFFLFSQITVNSSGKVGIGRPINTSYGVTIGQTVFIDQGTYPGIYITTGGPNYGMTMYPATNNSSQIGKSDKRFYSIYCNYLYKNNSDSTLKENIRDINNSLDIILKIRGIRFDFKKSEVLPGDYADNESINKKIEEKRKNKIGFIAQEMINVLPEAVEYDDSTNIYSIDYTIVIPVLVQAIKEQQIIIESLQSDIKSLKNQNNKTNESKSISITTEQEEKAVIIENTLYQNMPNPFSESTVIEYYLKDNVQKAMVCIYNMSGIQLKKIEINQIGYGSITINGGDFKAGMYLYALIVDGQIIDTKQMILTD